MTEELKRVGVVGLGVMGFDIAFLYAMKGYPTTVHDASKPVMESLADRREQTIERLRRRNRISDTEMSNVRDHFMPSLDLESVAKADLVTEAVSENASAKSAVYQALRNAGFKGILTTNTSSLTRNSLVAGGVYDRHKFASTHFFNPVLYTQMVEVVKGDMETAAYDTTFSVLKSLGRDPIETHDISGFVSNSILMIYAVMGLRLLECGARIEEIDQAAKEMRLLPPFISFDSWKPSIVEDVTRIMFELRGDSFLRSSKLLSVLSKENPRFYIEQKPNAKIYQLLEPSAGQPGEANVGQALKTAILIAAARVVELGESPATVDFIAAEGIKIPTPPLREIDTIGAATVLEVLAGINQKMADQPLAPPQLLTSMAREDQTFFKNDQPNPWLLSHVKQSIDHASH